MQARRTLRRSHPHSHGRFWMEQNGQLVPKGSGPLRLWVRADSLSPLNIAEGEARLVNDLTALPESERDGQEVRRWSLHLRHRERAAATLRVGSNVVPERPTMEGREDADAVESYEDRMAKYEDSIARANNWMSKEEVSTTFDSAIAIGGEMEMNKNTQSKVQPFRVLIPSVHFPSSRTDEDSKGGFSFIQSGLAGDSSSRKVWIRPSSLYSSESLQYIAETEIAYYARVELKNGSLIEVPGGRTSFQPGPFETRNSKQKEQIVQDQEIKILLSYSPVRPSALLCNLKIGADMGLNEGYQLEMTLTMPAFGLSSNESHALEGRILDTLDSHKLEPLRVRLRLSTSVGNHWVKDVVRKYRHDLAEEEKSGQDQDSSMRWPHQKAGEYVTRRAVGKEPKMALSVNSILERELDLLKRQHSGDSLHDQDDRRRNCRGTHERGDRIDKALKFTASLRMEDDVLPSDTSLFENIESSLHIEVDTSISSPKDQGPSEWKGKSGQGQDSVGEEGDSDAAWKSDWPGASSFAEHLQRVRQEPKPAWGPTLKATVPIKVLNSKRKLAPKRDADLQRALQRYHETLAGEEEEAKGAQLVRHYLDPQARSPILVIPPTDAQDLIGLLQDEDNFPLLSPSREVTTQDGGQDAPPTHIVPLRFLQPSAFGSADQDVGKIWAQKVLLPLHTHSSSDS